MAKKTFEFDQGTQLILTGDSATGRKKVVESGVVELTVEKRDSSAGFSWETINGNYGSISFTSTEVDIIPPEVADWFDSA